MGPKEKPLKAAIDIGSNTVLLLVGKADKGMVEVAYEAQHAPRLGKGVDAGHNLADDSIRKVVEVLKEYQSVLDEKFTRVRNVFVTATSAVRDAGNRQSFIDRVKGETGFSVQVLSGEEEAGYTFFGAKSVLPDVSGSCCVLDIGGGSTEVALGNKHILTDRYSYNIGSVRFTERYLNDDPPSETQLEACREATRADLKRHIFHFSPRFTLIGVAGTVTSLAHMEAGLHHYQPEVINGRELTIDIIGNWVERLKERSSKQLLHKYPDLLAGRADVFLGGLLILQSFMKASGIPKITVSTGGIRHGALVMHEK